MKSIKGFFLLAVVAGALHIVWESSHVSLYTGYETLGVSFLPIWVWATMGDVAYTLGAVLFVSLFKGNLTWVASPSKKDYIGLIILGFSIALLVEYKALALGRWEYLETMPIIPYLSVGLSPILQMTIFLPLSLWIASKIFQKK